MRWEAYRTQQRLEAELAKAQSPATQVVFATDPVIDATVCPPLPSGFYRYEPQGVHLLMLPDKVVFGAGYAQSSVFMHERRSRSGERHIVGVSAFRASTLLPARAVKTVLAFQFLEHAHASEQFMVAYDALPSSPADVRIYAGQPDPDDESHFTIVVSINGERTMLSGRLLDNGSVRIIRADDNGVGKPS